MQVRSERLLVIDMRVRNPAHCRRCGLTLSVMTTNEYCARLWCINGTWEEQG